MDKEKKFDNGQMTDEQILKKAIEQGDKGIVRKMKSEIIKEYYKEFAVGDGYDFKGRKFKLKHIDKKHNHLIFESVDLPKAR